MTTAPYDTWPHPELADFLATVGGDAEHADLWRGSGATIVVRGWRGGLGAERRSA